MILFLAIIPSLAQHAVNNAVLNQNFIKLYNFTPAANALRVEMFLNEKNIQLEIFENQKQLI